MGLKFLESAQSLFAREEHESVFKGVTHLDSRLEQTPGHVVSLRELRSRDTRTES